MPSISKETGPRRPGPRGGRRRAGRGPRRGAAGRSRRSPPRGRGPRPCRACVEPLDRRAHADRLGDRRGARLEAGRDVGVGRALAGDLADHRAAAEEGRHRPQQVEPAPERPDPGRRVELVAGDRVEVDAERGDVERHLRRRLGAVGDDDRAGVVGHRADLGERVLGAEDVGDVGDREELRAAFEQPAQRVQIEQAVVVDRRPVDLRPDPLGQLLPGHDVRVVLHLGQQRCGRRRRRWRRPRPGRRGSSPRSRCGRR